MAAPWTLLVQRHRLHLSSEVHGQLQAPQRLARQHLLCGPAALLAVEVQAVWVG